MSLRERLALWFRPAVYLGRNAATIIGAALTTGSAVTLICYWLFDLVYPHAFNPYLGALFFLILPGLFVLGLILMPAGWLWRRRGLRRLDALPREYPRVDFRAAGARRALAWLGGLSFANVLILSVASYRGVEYMDSVKFCGATCHVVMQPEYTAYQNSPHQRVACVDCHIGPGAGWFARSKLSGVRQVFAVTFHTYDRPIPAPVANLRPSRETCEQCHWPQMFDGTRLLVLRKFADDEKNTGTVTVLMMKIGGHTSTGEIGIHGHHLDLKSPIHYVALDRQRQVIAQVSYVDSSGREVVFNSTDAKATPAQLATGEHRTMDCMDCHNRPTHTFQLPDPAINQAMAQGTISPALPYIKKEAASVLQASYPDRQAARRGIAESLSEFYEKSYPEVYRDQQGALQAAIGQIQAIYLRNVFPAMNVAWGTYANNLGHTDSPGCFRCHDGSHVAADGRTIPNDCDTCHTVLAVDEPNPKILSELGMP